MNSFIEQAQFYAAYHQKPITRYTHFIGIPLIILSLMVFLSFFHLIVPGVLDATLASIATAFLLLYYFWLNWRLAAVLVPVFIVLLWIADWIGGEGPTRSAVWFFLISFVAGWALQLIGHFLEGRRPALLDNFWQALIAPLFLAAEVFFMSGRMQGLREEIYGKSEIVEPPKESEEL